MVNKFTIKIVLVLLFLTLLACNLLASSPEPGNETPATVAAAETEPPAPLEPSPTPSPLSPSPTPQPPTPEPAIAANIVPTPVVDFADLAPYRRAMLPEFAADVDTVAAAGASRYYLEVDLDFGGDEAGGQALGLQGLERVLYTNTETVPLTEIYFRLYPNLPGYGGQMDVEQVMVNDQLVQSRLEAGQSVLRLLLAQPLPPGAVADISLTYRANVPTDVKAGYNIFVYTEQTIALAGFYPVIAVYDDEGWNVDVPPPYGDATYLDVSLYQVRLTVPEAMVVAASGSLLASQAQADGTQTLSFASGPMRDFYLAMRPDYQVASELVDGVVVNSYYPPDLTSGGQLALRYAVDSLRVFNQRFGPYPYAEFDLVATPTTAGGVEYPGIVVVSQNIYDQQGGFFQHATVHEVAHQWWYGLVGNDQVDEPWLDESLTNYSTILYWEEVVGPEVAAGIIDSFFVEPYERAKARGHDRAVAGPVSDFSEAEYGIFVYGKGPLFFKVLRQELGDEIFLAIMQTYYTEYKYKIAYPDDLLAVIERVSGREIDLLFEQWIQ